jgi:transposase
MAVRDMNQMTHEELKKHYLNERTAMFQELEKLQNENITLKNQVKDNEINITDLQLQLSISQEQLKQLIAVRYQSQRNTVVLDMPTLFDDVEGEALKVEEQEKENQITVTSYTKTKPKKQKHIEYSNLEQVIETLPIPEGEDICEVCDSIMHIKKYKELKEIVFVPSKLYVKVTRIPVLECVECQAISEDGSSSYHTVSHLQPIYPRSLVSPELLAYIIDMKYNNGLPLYAIEKMFERQNVCIPRQNMANWVIGLEPYIRPLYEMMKTDLMKAEVIHADETTTQVLNEEGKPSTSTSYMFVYRSHKYDKPIVLYEYRSSRSGDGPKEFLEEYQGTYIVTDAYQGYNKVEGVLRAFCNVHALRKYKDAYKLLPNNSERLQSDEAKAIKKYDAIFHKEHEITQKADKKHLKGEAKIAYIQKRREEEIKPMFESFIKWLESIQPRNAGRYTMSQAIAYTLHHQVELMRFIENGYIAMDNSSCERSIRPFTVIRNRCKFYVSTVGAVVSALIYSLVITCIENRVQPYMYFSYLLEKLPNMDIGDEEALRKLLPYSSELPEYTRILSKRKIKGILSSQK